MQGYEPTDRSELPRERWRGAEDPPDPLSWRPRLPARLNIFRAIASPIAAGVVVFVAVIAVVAATVMLSGHDPAASAEGDQTETAWQSSDDSAEGEDDSTHAPTPASITVLVHVVGEVNKPGVVELREGARVADALQAAGGATDAAGLAGINLARLVADGEQVVVPNIDEADVMAQQPLEAGVATGGVVNLNAADAASLETLPRVGPSLAGRIVAWRDANGPFTSLEQLLEVSGIGQKTFEGLRDLVTL